MKQETWRAIGVVVLYFISLIVLIFCTTILKLRIYSGGWYSFPTAWGYLLLAWFFAVPFLFAIAAGWAIRPFVRSFVLVIAPIFFVHIIYGVLCSIARSAYVKSRNAQVELSRESRINIKEFSHQFLDKNADGLADEIIFRGHLDLSAATAGEYLISLYLTGEDRIARVGTIGEKRIRVNEKGVQEVDLDFTIDPANIKEALAKGKLFVGLELKKSLPVTSTGRQILTFCRWAPLILGKNTTLEGPDSDIFDAVIDITNLSGVDTFALKPSLVQCEPVIFQQFIGDSLRGLNDKSHCGDLVIEVAVDSVYSGPIYYSLDVEGRPDLFFRNRAVIAKGQPTIELVIPASELKKIGTDGPYRFKNIVLMNNDPYCPEGKCSISNTPVFTVYLPDHETGKFALDQTK